MPRRRVKSLKHGSAQDKPVVWHNEHRSKKNRRKKHPNVEYHVRMYKQKKLEATIEELDKEAKQAIKNG